MKRENPYLRILGTLVRIGLVIAVVFLLIRFSKWAYNFGYAVFAQKPVTENGAGYVVTVTVTEGQSVKSIAKMLEEKGLITDNMLFIVQERVSDYHGMIGAGNYDLSTTMTPEEMIQVMSAKKIAEKMAGEKESGGNSEIGGQNSTEDVTPLEGTSEEGGTGETPAEGTPEGTP